MARRFIAIDLPPAPALAAVLRDLRARARGVRVVRDQQLHLTLAFLGDRPADELPAITDALQQAAATADPFTLLLHGLGTFGRANVPRVLWAGVADSTPDGTALQALAHNLGQQLASALPGFEPDPRPFAAHLTLARIKHPRRAHPTIQSLCAQHADTALGTYKITALNLYESHLTPTGPHYHLTAHARL